MTATQPNIKPRRAFRARVGLPVRRRLRGRTNTERGRLAFLVAAASLDALAILAMAALTGAIFGHGANDHFDLVLGTMVALLFVLPGILQQDYAIARYLSHKGHAKRALSLWCVGFVGALVLAFLTKTSDSFSRGGTLSLFVVGYAALIGVRAALVQVMTTRAAAGRVTTRTVFLVGDEDMIRGFNTRHAAHEVGLRIVGAAVLRGEAETRADDLALAAASARVLRPDDIYILIPWGDRDRLEACIDTFMRLPATIHLAPEPFLDRFDDLHVIRNGSVASIHLIRRPLSSSEVIAKRAIDLVLSSLALVLLSPLFLTVAVAIKLDSRGPVLFVQRRYGFNQEPFRIYKFRSMKTLEDGRAVRQAQVGDSRITRVGAFIRKTNIDELPQLLNVLKGDMSLVGPRPHALAHDQAFEREVARYARRHNVRPGITGWAQVNGWRGETDTPEKVVGRVEHDLYYIDNWSLLLDLNILIRTVLSRKAYSNAR